MTEAVKPVAISIPQRENIDPKDKWDLTVIYKDDAAWEEDYKKAESLIEKANQYKDKLAEAPHILFDCLESRTSLALIVDNLYQYAKLYQDVDSRVSKYQEQTERAAMLESKASAAYSFVEPELMQIQDDELRKMASQFAKAGIYDFYIEEHLRARPHIRSIEVEELLAQSQMIARGPSNVFNMLDNADMKYPTIKDADGKDVQLTKQRYAKFMEAPRQDLRLRARQAFLSTYGERINTIGASLAAAINTDIFYSRARKYESSLHASLDNFNIPVSVYHSLLDTTEANLKPLHKLMAVRKKILKLDRIYPCDVYCPLFPDQNYEVVYQDAVKQVLKAVAPLGEEYITLLKNGFDNKWVDVFETEGKRGGAYSWGNYSTHPFVLMNYNDTVNNMFTLAHEMGHAMHSFFSNRKQPYPKAQYSIFVAEVASTLNEGLLLDFLLKKTDDKMQKLFLLDRHISNTFGTFFMQVVFARFELMIHTMVERGEALSPESAGELWVKLQAQYFGPELTDDEYSKYNWARIPHFYRTYYVYQYATSYAASQAILDKFLEGESGIVDKYLKLLSSGGSDYPINQLKKCGVDMTTSAPVEATLKLFAEQVDEVERLAEE